MCPVIFFVLPNFVQPYQSSKVPFSCLEAGQILHVANNCKEPASFKNPGAGLYQKLLIFLPCNFFFFKVYGIKIWNTMHIILIAYCLWVLEILVFKFEDKNSLTCFALLTITHNPPALWKNTLGGWDLSLIQMLFSLVSKPIMIHSHTQTKENNRYD